MAYNDSVRLYIKGDRVKGARYVRIARVLLWKLAREVASSGAASGRRTHRLSDGVVIELILAGLQAGIVITVPGGEPPEPEIQEHFVTHARTVALPDGIDASYPQLMHRFERKTEQWRTLFYDKDIAGYDVFAGRKGTYRTQDGLPVFEDGITHAGNVDWRSKDGVRLHWYGPSTRYFYDAHIKPEIQYGKFVFMLGQIVLDVEQYIIDSEEDTPFDERYVMGAALDGNSLLVVQADLPPGITDETPAPPNYADLTTPWPTGDVPILVCRYALSRGEGEVAFKAVPNSREVLYSNNLHNALQPWFFNTSATAAVSVGLPDSAMLQYDFPTLTFDYIVTGAPSTSQPVYTLTFENGLGVVATTSVGLSTGENQAVVAVDFVGDEKREATIRRSSPYDPPLHDLADKFEFSLGANFALQEGEFLGVIATRPSYRVHERHVLFADIRSETVVLQHYQGTMRVNATTIDQSENIEIWRKGQLVATIEADSTFLNTGWGRETTYLPAFSDGIADILNLAATLSVAPAFALYQTYVAFRTSSHSHWLWQGGHGLNCYLAYPETARFGVARVNYSADVAVQRLDAYSDTEFDGDRLDIDGHYSVLGCATYDDITVFSGYGLGYQTGQSVSFADFSTLPTLTGVAGAKERYHPIWLLGTLPR